MTNRRSFIAIMDLLVSLRALLLAVCVTLVAGCQHAKPTTQCGPPSNSFKLAKAERVVRARRLLAAGKEYPLGSADFVCDVLQIDYEPVKDLIGDTIVPVSSVILDPGDVVGWTHFDLSCDPQSESRVAIYVGSGDPEFIYVARAGEAPRSTVGFGSQPLYKSSRSDGNPR